MHEITTKRDYIAHTMASQKVQFPCRIPHSSLSLYIQSYQKRMEKEEQEESIPKQRKKLPQQLVRNEDSNFCTPNPSNKLMLAASLPK